MTISLDDYLKTLTYAAGPGAARLASSVTTRGNVAAQIGTTGPRRPGPGLRAVQARAERSTGRDIDAASEAQIPVIADRAARDALKQGADLLRGGD